MAITPGRGHEALRRGRFSQAGADYFLTCCTEQRQTGLERRENTEHLFAAATRLVNEGVWTVRTGVVMPDHIHLFILLGGAVELSAAVRLFKGRTSPLLRRAGLRWEHGYFDHRVRIAEDRFPIFRYILLNPYRSQLVTIEQKWPGYFCADEDWAWFGQMTGQDCPMPQWLL